MNRSSLVAALCSVACGANNDCAEDKASPSGADAVSIITSDDLCLVADHYRGNEGAPAVVLLHMTPTAWDRTSWSVDFQRRLYGLGWSAYWSDGWNVLDGSIVSLSIVEIIVSATLLSDSGASPIVVSFVRMLRILRVLRMLRMIRAWSGLYSTCITFVRAVQQLSNLLLLMFLITTMLALVGMQLFGGGFNSSNGFTTVDKPRAHFDYFYPAVLTSFTLSEQIRSF